MTSLKRNLIFACLPKGQSLTVYRNPPGIVYGQLSSSGFFQDKMQLSTFRKRIGKIRQKLIFSY